MFRPRTTALVAVSGGVDSVVLLDALCRLNDILAIDLIVAHLDHALRDVSSDDAAFVATLASERGIPCIARRVEPQEWNDVRRYGMEGAARAIRRRFLLEASYEHGADAIALGHTASDRAETVLYRLARGTGVSGLAAMPAVSKPFVRPMLDVSRDDVRAYARERGLSWREDKTNLDLARPRNRIRHELIPQLHRINPEATDAVCRLADLAADAVDIEKELVDRLWSTVSPTPGGAAHTPGGAALSREAVRSLSPALQRAVLRRAIEQVRGHLVGIEKVHVECVRRLIGADRERDALDLPGIRVAVRGDVVTMMPLDTSCVGEAPAPAELGLGRTELPQWGLAFDLSEGDASAPPAYSRDPMTETIDADTIDLPLLLRSRQPGDRFSPLGLSTPMRLKEFLINEKVPVSERDRLPLLCSRGRIVWIVGHRLSDDARLRPTTKRVIRMKAERIC